MVDNFVDIWGDIHMTEPNFNGTPTGTPTEQYGAAPNYPQQSAYPQPQSYPQGYQQQPYQGLPQYPGAAAQQYPTASSAPETPAASAPAPFGGQPALPPSNAGWAVATIIFFWPLAFSAFNHAFSIFPKWSSGDYHGAQYASDRVKTLGKIALGIFVGLVVLYVVFLIIVVATAANEVSTYR